MGSSTRRESGSATIQNQESGQEQTQIRRQHLISKFYLDGFASPKGRTLRVELPGDRSVVLSTRDSMVVKDFYTLEMPDGSRSDFFEHALGEIEGPASRALRATLSGEWPPSSETREALSMWIALQLLRGEEIRSSQGYVEGFFYKLIIGTSGKAALKRRIQEAVGREVSEDELDREWADLTKPGGPTLKPDPKAHIQQIAELAPPTALYLADCQWIVRDFQRKSLLTCDSPVSMEVAVDHPPYLGVGIATADLFHVPLSRRCSMVLQPRRVVAEQATKGVAAKFPDIRIRGTAIDAKVLNQATISNANRYLFMHPDDRIDPVHLLPHPRPGSRIRVGDEDRLISEEGLFSNQQTHMSATADDSSPERGVSLQDIPWPIPRRIVPWET